MSGEGKIRAFINDEIRELIPSFFQNTWEEVQSLHNAIVNGDYDEIRRLGHSIKGASAGYGFEDLSEKGRFIETAAAERKTPDELTELLQDIVWYLENVEVVYGFYDE